MKKITEIIVAIKGNVFILLTYIFGSLGILNHGLSDYFILAIQVATVVMLFDKIKKIWLLLFMFLLGTNMIMKSDEYYLPASILISCSSIFIYLELKNDSKKPEDLDNK